MNTILVIRDIIRGLVYVVKQIARGGRTALRYMRARPRVGGAASDRESRGGVSLGVGAASRG